MDKTSDNQGNPPHHNYLIFQTLEKQISSFKRIGLVVPSKEYIASMEADIISFMRENLKGSDVSLNIVDFNGLCDEIISLASKKKGSFGDVEFISTSPLIAYEASGTCLEINRLINFEGDVIAIGPRPGFPDIEKQISKVQKKSVVILEDGSWTGQTMQFVVNKLAEQNIDVRAIILGVLFPKAKYLLGEKENIEILPIIKDTSAYIEWIPTHDFIPFFPNAGRVIGNFIGNKCFPIYLYNYFSISMPYIFPYGDPETWASLSGEISPNSEHSKSVIFSKECLMLAWRFFDEMDKINKKTLVIEDFLNCYPSVSLPITSTVEHNFHKWACPCRTQIYLATPKDTLSADIKSLTFLDYERVKPQYRAEYQLSELVKA